jgi:hypothetical protein
MPTKPTTPTHSHTCAVCPKPIRPHLLMCAHHWHQVPRDLQQAVNSTWRTFLDAKGPHRRLTALKPYRDARDAALASVADAAEPTTATTRDRR